MSLVPLIMLHPLTLATTAMLMGARTNAEVVPYVREHNYIPEGDQTTQPMVAKTEDEIL